MANLIVMNEIVNKLEKHFGIHCVSKHTSEQDRINVIIKPLLVADCMYGYFYDLKKEDFKFKDKQCYKQCKRDIDDFFTWIFSPLNDEEKEKLDDAMSEQNEYMKNNITYIEMAFHDFLIFLPTDIRIVLAKLYTIAVMAQLVSMTLAEIKVKSFKIDSFCRNLYEIQKSYMARNYPKKCEINPNNEKKIHDMILCYINDLLKYQVK